MILWPIDLPRPMRSGYQRGLPDGRLSTRPEAGPPRMRRRFSSAVSPMATTFTLTLDQRMRFWRFWEEVGGGTLPFVAPDWTLDGQTITDGSGLVITDDAGSPILVTAPALMMFAGDQAPSESLVGVEYRITVQFSILP
jgi:hypothetical protein